MRHVNVLVLGGSGFIGRYIVNQLVGQGCRVVVPARRRDKAKHLIVLPTCDVIEADIHDDAALRQLMTGHDAVVNLVGILHGSAQDFERAHTRLAQRVIAACEAAGIDRLLHMSALGADENGPSEYQRSKGRAEAAVRASRLQWTVFRPSVVFGPEDHFLNLFASLARWFPVLPIGGADAKFQPVWVEDVAASFTRALDNEATYRKIYELAGPQVYTLRELVSYAARTAGHPRPVIGMSDGVARLQARFMELLPGEPLLSRDNLASLKRDNVASIQPFMPAPELSITPTPLEAETYYLQGMHPRTRFGGFRARARR
jgi:NADH dehydrogenase